MKAASATMAAGSFKKVECAICGHRAHFLQVHLEKDHGLTVEEYQVEHSGAPVLSQAALSKLGERAEQSKNKRVPFEVRKTFGCKVFDHKDTVMGYEHPHESTPKPDPFFHFDPELLSACLFALENSDERVLFQGPTGSGKSSTPEQVAARLNLPYYFIGCDCDLSHADFIGQERARAGETYFQYGILPRAIRDNAMLVVDEWDAANPAVGMVLQSVLQGKPLTITETGEVIDPRDYPGFRIFATSNTLGQGDETGLYNGTQPQNFATLDRFTVTVNADYPTQTVERAILTKATGIEDKETLAKLTETAQMIRAAFVKQEIRTTVSTRSLINIARKLIQLGDVKKAFEWAFLNKLNSEDKAFCKEIIQRKWGSEAA